MKYVFWGKLFHKEFEFKRLHLKDFAIKKEKFKDNATPTEVEW